MTQQRRFTKEFAEEALRLVQSSGRTQREIAGDLGIGLSTLVRWIERSRDRHAVDPSAAEGDVTAELKRLRRETLETAARAMVEDDFADRVLPFDREAAVAYGDLFAARRRVGRPSSTADLMIASIACAKAASVVTRDVGDFEHCGPTVIDPCTAS